jgi:hypothetical protein
VKILWIVLISACACAQQPNPQPAPSAPLQCGKYQHVEHWPGRCGPAPSQCDSESIICSAVAVCSPPPPDKCVDDVHEVTEAEWQQTMANTEAIKRSLGDLTNITELQEKEIHILRERVLLKK